MKTENMILIGAGVALAGGAAWYFLRQRTANKVMQNYASNTQVQSTGIAQQSNNLLNTVQKAGTVATNLLQSGTQTPKGNLEGKLIRVAGSSPHGSGAVYVVRNNLLHWVSKLPTADGLYNWGQQLEVTAADVSGLKEGQTYDEMMASGAGQPIDPSQPWLGTNGLGALPLMLTLS
jgi:hypothetical protein